MADMRLIVVGAGGRMGRTLVKAIADHQGLSLAAAVESKARRSSVRMQASSPASRL